MADLDKVFESVDWNVHKENMNLTNSGQHVSHHRALQRSDTGSVLSIVGKDYIPVQNNQILEFIRPVVESGLLEPGRIQTYKNGQICSLACRIPGQTKSVKVGDIVGGGVRVDWGHGGRGINVRPYFLRLICTNGLTGSQEGRVWRFTHTGKVYERLVRFNRILLEIIDDFARSVDVYARMAETKLPDGQFSEYVKRTYNLKEMQEVGAELAARSQTPDMDEVMSDLLAGARDQVDGEERREVVEDMLRLPRNFDQLEDLYLGGAPGAGMALGTVWGAYNAITYHVDHVSGRTAESRAWSAAYGPGAKLRQRAYNEAVKLTR